MNFFTSNIVMAGICNREVFHYATTGNGKNQQIASNSSQMAVYKKLKEKTK